SILAVVVVAAGELRGAEKVVAVAIDAGKELRRGVPFAARQAPVAIVIEGAEALGAPVVLEVDRRFDVAIVPASRPLRPGAHLVARQPPVAVPVVVAERLVVAAPFLARDHTVAVGVELPEAHVGVAATLRR